VNKIGYSVSLAVIAGVALLVPSTLAAQQALMAGAYPGEENAGGSSSFVRPIPAPQAAPSSFYQRFSMHNASMKAFQPSFITPVVEADPRLVQYARASFSNQYTAARTQTVSYGNTKGGGVIVGNRFEFDYMPPAYIQHNTPKSVDGPGDTSALAKFRIISGNADHGNYIVSALLSHAFATGTYKNGAPTDSFTPTLAAAVGFLKRFDVESTLGGTMPTGKIATQGRTIVWNALSQMHATSHVWFEVENNASFYFSGSHDGKMQNFVTPAAFYVVRRREWKPNHPFMIVDTGMQIATSGFHTYNHNLISEARLLF